MVNKSPFAWIESKAADFPTLYDSIGSCHPSDHPVSPFMILVIFFEETGFCNIKQAHAKGGLGIGFGQLEISNPEKRDFFEWAGLPSNYQAVAMLMLGDTDFAVKVHCQYFQYLTSQRGLSLDGCLSAQVGWHTEYKLLFRQGADMLKTTYVANDRPGCIAALNYSRAKGKCNNIPESLFPEFWQFILPDSMFGDATS